MDRAPLPFWRGVFATLSCLILGLALLSPLVSGVGGLTEFARLADSLLPQLLLASLGPLLLLALLGGWRLAGVGLLAALVGAAGYGGGHLARALPGQSTAPADLEIVHFNVLSGNDLPWEVATALRGETADIVVLLEAQGMRPHLPRIAQDYPHQAGCERVCGTVVLSKHPLEVIDVRNLGPLWRERQVTVRVLAPSARPLLTAVHMVKPWYDAVSRVEYTRLRRRVNRLEGPLIVVGDFNAAPWARPMRAFLRETRLAPQVWPVATWPAGAGDLGVPIDHVLVRDGAGIVGVERWGEGLGSNHAGLKARIAVE